MTFDPRTIPSDMILFLAQRPEDFGQFLAATGLGPSDIKDALDKPETLAGIMDYFLQNSELMQEFLKEHGISPKDILKSRMSLPGANLGDVVLSH